MDWVIEELETLSLGDERLNKRAKIVLSQLSHNPTDSIPVSCLGFAETKAAYRFFDNKKVTMEKVLRPHLDATLVRIQHHPVVLIPQDTTVFNFTGQVERNDAGPTTKKTTNGMFFHCAIAVTPEKVCLGVVSNTLWHRDELQDITRSERSKRDYGIAFEDKESFRWLENYRIAQEIAIKSPNTKVVSIADRKGDIYKIYEEASQNVSLGDSKSHYLIRAKTDRRTCTEEGKKNTDKIKSTLTSEPSLGQISIELSETKKRKSRVAHLNVYSKKIHIALPDKIKKPQNYQPVEITAILCQEVDAPTGEEVIEWLLITDMSISSFEEACKKSNGIVVVGKLKYFLKY